jgi:hypothetical protein
MIVQDRGDHQSISCIIYPLQHVSTHELPSPTSKPHDIRKPHKAAHGLSVDKSRIEDAISTRAHAKDASNAAS